MQTARVFRLIETTPARARRGRAPTLRVVAATPPSCVRRAPRKRRRNSGGWIRSILMVFVVAAEWLIVAADILSRLYFV
jgi:hypothetical protein